MDKYKINYIFNEEKDINEIFIKILNIELKKYIGAICKNKKCEGHHHGSIYLKEGNKGVREFK